MLLEGVKPSVQNQDATVLPALCPFDWMVGDWQVDRVVPGMAGMRGSARVVLLHGDTALYSERVSIQLQTGERVEGARKYLYCRTDAGLDVLFEDTGRLYQSLQFRREGSFLLAEATHDCGMDRYASEYRIHGQDNYTVRHVVRGPRKDYEITTTYRRTGGA
jgi:hypothetical protein